MAIIKNPFRIFFSYENEEEFLLSCQITSMDILYKWKMKDIQNQWILYCILKLYKFI